MLSESAAVSLPADVKEVLNRMDVWREAASTNHMDAFVRSSGWIEWPISTLVDLPIWRNWAISDFVLAISKVE